MFRLVFNDSAKVEGLALAEPWRGVAVRLAAAELEDRPALWHALPADLPAGDWAVLERALGGVAAVVPQGTPAAKEADSAPGDKPVLLPMPAVAAWPEPLKPEALQGVAGDLVRAIEPTTEADPAAILIQFLVAFGSLIGKGAHIRVDGHDHHANLFAVIVGDTSRARKGTSWRRVREALATCDPCWAAERVLGGLSSGEGVIWAVRDPIWGTNKKGQEICLDAGIDDKRLLVVENEFGGALRVMGREGSTLSAILRQAYDGETLRFLTKHNPAVATAPHVSLCGHITREELQKHLSSVEAFNGLGNRILWTCARRSKALPFGGDADAKIMETLAEWLARLADDARGAHELSWTSSGAKRWDDAYDDLTTSQPGLLGAVTSRAEAHALRLAMIYALLDRQREIADDHVEAALAVWRYCADSADLLFGRSTTDSKTNAVLAALRRHGDGMTRAEIHRRLFSRDMPATAVTRVMDSLVQAGSVLRVTDTTGGRPAERYFAV
ncbi:MAG: DUF3987 domain-containing protein [Paludisphaera borealis]|uniref:DUF3987 domain-containing protein n=1 Tax=Paludisphaera borealis TaxID=1387353 RepID=UPI00284B6EBA|nr:DUF3987 domain-containing protein [Paludisphaera borealis]MDR3622766.1 DUF3987 domain-containing protein [Paludisphaera borealis]